MSEEKKIGGRAFGAELNVEKFIEEQIGCFVKYISVGPERESIIIR